MEKCYNNIASKVCPRYPRPRKFSDPGGDFSDEELNDLIRKQDNALTEADLMCIFQGALPAGDYQEVMYFLPAALPHIAVNKEVDTEDHLLHWISCNKEKLQSDGCYNDLLNFFEQLFAHLTAESVLEKDYLKDGSLCDTIIDCLNEYFDLYGDFLLQKYLLPIENYVQAAWLLYFLEHHYMRLSRTKSNFLEMAAYNNALRQKVYDLILEEALKDENTLLFWDKTLQNCGIV